MVCKLDDQQLLMRFVSMFIRLLMTKSKQFHMMSSVHAKTSSYLKRSSAFSKTHSSMRVVDIILQQVLNTQVLTKEKNKHTIYYCDAETFNFSVLTAR